jgi:NAD(P)-dependent dehydrogenase (short-subunit alcohol dehydrogenase family)
VRLENVAPRHGTERCCDQPLAHVDGRVTPLALDVTNTTQIQGAVEMVDSLDILINNPPIVGMRTWSARRIDR